MNTYIGHILNVIKKLSGRYLRHPTAGSVGTLLLLFTNVSATRSATLDIYLNSDWTFNHISSLIDDCDDNIWLNVHDFRVTVGTETRYYYGGHWTAVNLWNSTGSTLLQSLSCNSVFYIKNSQAYALNVNSNGSLDGVTGGTVNETCTIVNTEVTPFFSLSNGDVIIVGDFGAAGGNDHAYNFTCYEWSNGWLHAQGINVNCPLKATDVSWNNNRLDIFKNTLNTVVGPTTSGGTKVTTSVSSTHEAFWNGRFNSFVNGYWQTQ